MAAIVSNRSAKQPAKSSRNGGSPSTQSSPYEGERRRVYATIDLDRVSPWKKIEVAYQALIDANTPPEFFSRNGSLVRVCSNELGEPSIQPVDDYTLSYCLTRIVDFRRGGKEVDPPARLPKVLFARLNLSDFPHLEGIVRCPSVRPDGSILQEEGYDPATQLFYAASADMRAVVVPEHPTALDVQKPLAVINEILVDFPFKDEASHANAVALLFSPFVRPAINECVPMALGDGNKMGTGKTLFSDIFVLVATGSNASMITPPTNEDEWRKLVTTLSLAGDQCVVLDNVTEPLRSPTLSSYLTSSSRGDRLLGSLDKVQSVNQSVWIANGNNIRLAGDMPRRVFWIRFDPRCSKPYLREGFKHPNLKRWVKENRAQIVQAILTVIRAWFSAGCPTLSKPPAFGGYKEWTDMMHCILTFAGVEGFLGNQSEVYRDLNEGDQETEAFLLALYQIFGGNVVQVSEVHAALNKNPQLAELAPIELLENPSGRDKSAVAAKKAIGNYFKQLSTSRFGDSEVFVARAGTDRHTKTALWKFGVGIAGSAGSAGS